MSKKEKKVKEAKEAKEPTSSQEESFVDASPSEESDQSRELPPNVACAEDAACEDCCLDSFFDRWFPQWGDIKMHFKKNQTTWIAFGVSILMVAKGNEIKGALTLLVMMFLVYIIHYEAHFERNWLTISHHYHHENNNFWSHLVQILMEMQFGLIFPFVNEFFMNNILDRWTIILLYLIYTTLHNINYSILHINKTHELHHKDILTNMGPDICDIIGGTKNQSIKDTDEYIEDTSHYIPNIIVCTIIVNWLKKMYETPMYRLIMDTAGMMTLAIISVVISISNSYLLFFYKSPAAVAKSDAETECNHDAASPVSNRESEEDVQDVLPPTDATPMSKDAVVGTYHAEE